MGPNTVSVADPASVDAVLGFHSNLDKSDQVLPMQNAYKGQPLPMLISAIDAKLHAKLRRPVAGAYSLTTLLQSEDVADECINKLIQGLATKHASSNEACSLDRWMHFLAFDFIGLATFSKPFGFLDKGADVNNMIKIIDLQFIYIATLGNLPVLDRFLLKNPLLLALVETPNPLVDMARECIDERRSKQTTEKQYRSDFLTKFLEAQTTHADVVSDLQVAAYVAANSTSPKKGDLLAAKFLY
jgi:cytochrome P450